MSEQQKSFAIGEDDFEHLITQGGYYVDKTEYIKKMASEISRYFFLARPRRFGKSLFLSTLKAAFEGRRELFKGLYLEDHWDWEKTNPVIHLIMNECEGEDRQEFRERFMHYINRVADELDVELKDTYPDAMLSDFICAVAKKHQKQVVVLIDEYDGPLLSFINNQEGFEPIQKEMQKIYRTLKNNKEKLRFVFLTGITSVAKTSIFSGLNNTIDISFEPEYNKICGYTEEELYKTFPEEMKHVNIHELKKNYNGYSWGSKETLYNPFALLWFFRNNMSYEPYWMRTSMTSYFVEYAKGHTDVVDYLTGKKVNKENLISATIGAFPPEAMLFQNGYLTLDIEKMNEIRKSQSGGDGIFSVESLLPNDVLLKVPNQMIKEYFIPLIIAEWTGKPNIEEVVLKFALNLKKIFETKDALLLKDNLNSIIAMIPNEWFPRRQGSKGVIYHGFEGTYAIIIYLSLTLLYGAKIIGESSTAQGRADMVVEYDATYYIFEFKLVTERSPSGAALRQMKERDYARRYKIEDAEVYLVPVEIDPDHKEVVALDFMNEDDVA